MITREQATMARVSQAGRMVRARLARIAWALLTVAANPDMRHPISLTFEGDHWLRTVPPVPKHPHYATEPTPELTERGRAAIAAARAAIRKREDEK